jgi:hypothetical protein
VLHFTFESARPSVKVSAPRMGVLLQVVEVLR